MIRFMQMAIAGLVAATPAAAQTVSGTWNYQFQNGIEQYLTGNWDSTTGGALSLSCLENGRVTIMAQIKGQAPPPRSTLLLTASSAAGSVPFRFTTDAQGDVEVPANAPALRQLWTSLRARDIVTLRYADGRTSVQSLAGARKLLPAKPCG